MSPADDIAAQLAQAIHDAVLPRLPSAIGTTPGQTTVMFAEIGRPVVPADFSGPSQLLDAQAASFFVDCLPEPGTSFMPASTTFSAAYGELLASAEPADGLGPDALAAAFEALSAARALVEDAKVGELNAPITYLPTVQEPSTWWDPAGPQWSSLAVSETGPPPGSSIRPPGWYFRVLPDVDQRRFAPGEAPPSPRPPSSPLATGGVRFNAPMAAAVLTARPDVSSTGTAQLVKAITLAPNWPERMAVLQNIVANSTLAAPTSTGFSLQMSYTYVSLLRPWLAQSWLERTDWRIPGYPPGTFSAADPGKSGQLLPVIPIGFVVAKDVIVHANWSAQDMTILGSAPSLGPFVLSGGGAVASGTLIIPGQQIIAWMCQIPPELPPAI